MLCYLHTKNIVHSVNADKEELGHVLRSVGEDVTSEELRTIMEKADTDSSGQIDFDEFYAMVKARLIKKKLKFHLIKENEIRDIFQAMDTDHNGTLDELEFKYAISKQLNIKVVTICKT